MENNKTKPFYNTDTNQMDKKELLLSGYEITSNENFSRKLNPIPHSLDIQLGDLYDLALKGKKSAVKKFIRLIEKYPNVPMLKNYLSVLYSSMGQIEKSHEVNHWIVAEHPDYLFGKLNLAAEYYTKEEYSKIPEVLGEYMELKKLYPQRDVFHTVEVSGFFKISILYFSAIGNLEQAGIRLDILKEIAPESADLEIAEEHFHIAKMEAAMHDMATARKDWIEIDIKKTVLTDIKAPPKFTHKEISLLYENDFFLDKKLITEILALPRQSLIEDLNKVLEDSIVRFNYFNTKADNGDFDDITYSFVIHSLFILSEIEATESKENILDVLRQDSDYIQLYIGDILSEYMWLILYKTATSELGTYKQYMFEPGIYTFNKTSVSEMANQIAQHQPHRKDEVIEWYRDIFRFFLKSSNKDNVIDSNLLGILVNDILDFKATELMPEVEELYKREIVDLNSCGDIEEVKKHLNDNKDIGYKKEIISIFDIYEEIQTWADNEGYDDYYEEGYIPTNSYDDGQPIITGKKVGRNNPCPCGSGKKYKKCCLNKNS